jgi:predicted amidohydrolase YtcJ
MANAGDLTVWLGHIWTGHRNTDALAVRDGHIVALGRDARSLVGDAAEVIELGDGLLMASFGDGHAHPVFGGMEFQGPSVRAARTPDDVVGAVARWAEAHPEAEWISGGSYDPTIASEGKFDARWLDAAVPDRPVVLRALDYHTVWVNSVALERAGISADTPEPGAGEIVRRPDGSPLGTLREPDATDLVLKLLPEPSLEDRVRALSEAGAVYAASGLTWCQDAWVEPELAEVYLEAHCRGESVMRSNLAFRADPETWRNQVDLFTEMRANVRERADNEMLTANTVKIFADGVIEGGTAAMLDSYVDAPHSCGMEIWPAGELAEAAAAFDQRGFQLHIHAIGDAAIRNALDAVEATRANPYWDRRPVIAHAQVVNPDDLPRFAQLGVIANFEPFWAQLDPLQVDLSIPRIGDKRAAQQYPMAAMLRHGTIISFGSDWPVSSQRPLDGIQVAVTRCTFDATDDDEGWLPHERLSVEQALWAYTAGVAYQAFAETRWGSLHPGAHADLVWLSQDPRTVDPMAISKIAIIGTWLGGLRTYG